MTPPSGARDERPPSGAPSLVASVEGARVGVPEPGRARRHAFEVALLRAPALLLFSAENREEQEAWLASLSVAAVPPGWPGGVDAARRPLPLLYSLWALGHVFPGSSMAPVAPTAVACTAAGGAGARAARAGAPAHESPLPRYPALRSVPPWQRRSLALRKLRLCTVMFDGTPTDCAAEEREAKRNTLLEIVDYIDESGGGGGGGGSAAASTAAARSVLADGRFLDDVFGMLRCNLFRVLPAAPPPSGDPDEDEGAFCDPQWPQLNIAYELLLRLVRRPGAAPGGRKRGGGGGDRLAS